LFAVLVLAAAAMPTVAQQQPPRPGQQPPTVQPRAHTPPQQQPAPQPKPYQPVTISAPRPVNDPSFEAFRKQVEAAASRKDRAALSRLVAKEFFWMGERGDKANKRKSGLDNLAAAMQLNARDSGGWEALIGFASDPTAMPLPQREGVLCAPADPVFDPKALEAVAKATGTDPSDWGYPVQPGLEVRSGPQPAAPVIEKLDMHFVWVVDDGGSANQQAPVLRIVTPSGKTGFVPADALSPLGSDQLCYAKDAGGAWKIAGFIGGE
jgi:hypothetical protein